MTATTNDTTTMVIVRDEQGSIGDAAPVRNNERGRTRREPPPPLSPADIEYCENLRVSAIRESIPEYREPLRRLYDLFDEINTRYYGGALTSPIIRFTAPNWSRALGDCSWIAAEGVRATQIRIRYSLLTGDHPVVNKGEEYAEGRFLYVADVLLGQMGRQQAQEISGETEDSYYGHGRAYAAICNRIGADLGLPPVRAAKGPGSDARGADGERLPSCAQWPHNVRPVDYYRGANILTSEDGVSAIAVDAPTVPNVDAMERSSARQFARAIIDATPSGTFLRETINEVERLILPQTHVRRPVDSRREGRDGEDVLARDSRIVFDLQHAYRATGVGFLCQMLHSVIEFGAWREFDATMGGHVTYERFEDFVLARFPHGLGTTMEDVRWWCGRDADALAALDEVS